LKVYSPMARRRNWRPYDDISVIYAANPNHALNETMDAVLSLAQLPDRLNHARELGNIGIR
jgi:hypothetical protein